MIDEKGRLFGKVNIVDLLIVIIILAAAAFLGYKLLGPQSTTSQTSSKRAPRSGTARTTSPSATSRIGAPATARVPSPTSPARSWR